MVLQAASAHLEVAAGYASGRIWAEYAGTRCGMLGDDVRPNWNPRPAKPWGPAPLTCCVSRWTMRQEFLP